jgi:hypothetical protein
MALPAWRGESALSMGLAQGTIGTRDPARAPGSVRTDTVAVPRVDLEAVGVELRRKYTDLRRHFVFEYYPWYATNPWRHWNHPDRQPPAGIATTSMPKLGPYDSRDLTVIEQHARWITDSGAGGINISWWGPGSYEDRAVHRIMDVMRDHDLKVTFHLEPYDNNRVDSYASDIQYLITEYGDKRHWDCQLLLRNADGAEGPVFKAFATIQPQMSTDCHGRTTPLAIWRPNDVWHRQTDAVRETLRRHFDNVWLLSDFPVADPVLATGFDGASPYGAFTPQEWPQLARAFSALNLSFSPSIGTGFDAVVERNVPADSCYQPPAFVPPAEIDWSLPSDRERAARLAVRQIETSMRRSLDVQTNPMLRNASTGFFIVYIATFNEWHEGTSFEPMKDHAALLPQELPFGYHNPANGRYRLDYLKPRLDRIIRG